MVLRGTKGMQESSIQPCFCDAADGKKKKMDLARLSLDFSAFAPSPAMTNHAAFKGTTWGLLDLTWYL